MSTLFLIGNGFDINCGMKTSYRDVYKGYLQEEATTYNLKKFKNTISGDLKNWGDFEIAMANYSEELQNEEEFLECVRDFAEYMEKHLILENEKFRNRMHNKEMYQNIIEEADESFSFFYSGISHNVDTMMANRNASHIGTMEVISFNYTDAFDDIFLKYLEACGYGEKDIIHIHGVLEDGPVLGVDNNEQIKAKFDLSRKGKRGFIKPFFNESFDQHRVEEAKKKIRYADTICVYGMSLGESDLSWRNEIIKWLRENKHNQLFIYQYMLADVKYKTVAEKMDIEETGKEKLFSEWGLDNSDPIFEQIHIPCGKNIFNFEKVIEKTNKKILENKIRQGEEAVSQYLQDIVPV